MLKYVHIFIMLNLLRNHDAALLQNGGQISLWPVDSNEIRMTTANPNGTWRKLWKISKRN